MIDSETTIYRSAREFPPAVGEYRTQFDRRGRPIGRSPEQRRASTGLSVYRSLNHARRNGTRNGHIIGHLIVRYTIPVGYDLSLERLVGDEGHFTLLGPDLALLPDFLDRDWHEDLRDGPP